MLTIEQISCGFGRQEILHDISLSIPEGKITAIVGQSGCGKTTFLKTLNRMIEEEGGFYKGKIILDGEDIKGLSTEVLLLDEPCSALDMKNTIAIEETLLELKGKYTFVIVTHNLAQAKRIADQIIFMDQGRVLEVTDTKTFFEHPSSEPAREQIQYM